MKWTRRRVALAAVDGIAALSAIGGGSAVMAGVINPGVSLTTGNFSWLISDYFVAGEILLFVIGGSALAALLATFFSQTAGAGFSAAAGLIMMGWIVSEALILGAHWLQLVYFVVGLAMLMLAGLIEPAELRATVHRLRLT